MRRFISGDAAQYTYSDPDINTQARADALSKYATQGNQDAIDAFEAAAEDLQVAQDALAAKREEQKDAIAELEERRAALEREFERLEALEKERQEAERRRRAAAARAAAAASASSSRIPPQRPGRRERPERPGRQRAGRRDRLPGAGPGRLQRHLGRRPLRRPRPQGRRHALADGHAHGRAGERHRVAPRQRHRRPVVAPQRRQRPLLLRHPPRRPTPTWAPATWRPAR